MNLNFVFKVTDFTLCGLFLSLKLFFLGLSNIMFLRNWPEGQKKNPSLVSNLQIILHTWPFNFTTYQFALPNWIYRKKDFYCSLSILSQELSILYWFHPSLLHFMPITKHFQSRNMFNSYCRCQTQSQWVEILSEGEGFLFYAPAVSRNLFPAIFVHGKNRVTQNSCKWDCFNYLTNAKITLLHQRKNHTVTSKGDPGLMWISLLRFFKTFQT